MKLYILMDFYAFLSFSCFHTLEFLFSNPDKFIIDYLVDYIYRLKKNLSILSIKIA